VLSLLTTISLDDAESSDGWSISFAHEAGPTREQIAFSEYLICARIVPFESSPLSAESLGSIVMTTGVGMGAYAGYVVAGHTPLLFVLVPAGMVLFGAAAGIGKALEEGLRERILRLISHSGHPKKSHPKR
jgi:hypothetical protein